MQQSKGCVGNMAYGVNGGREQTANQDSKDSLLKTTYSFAWLKYLFFLSHLSLLLLPLLAVALVVSKLLLLHFPAFPPVSPSFFQSLFFFLYSKNQVESSKFALKFPSNLCTS